MRSGGLSASTTLKIAGLVEDGLPRFVPPRRALSAARASAYAGCSALRTADGPAQSVLNPPGSISVTWIPNPATSAASDWEKASSAHFEA
jgi:hypothetical protein